MLAHCVPATTIGHLAPARSGITPRVLRLSKPDNDSAEEPIVKVRGLRFSRGNRMIFDGVDLDIPRGGITAIMGPSGTGKTTLLKLIGGQLRPDAGEIWVNGANVHQISRARLFELRKTMGMLFQSGALLTDLTVFDNVAFPLREHTRLPPELIRNLVLMKLEAVGLRNARGLWPRPISGDSPCPRTPIRPRWAGSTGPPTPCFSP